MCVNGHAEGRGSTNMSVNPRADILQITHAGSCTQIHAQDRSVLKAKGSKESLWVVVMTSVLSAYMPVGLQLCKDLKLSDG